MLIQTTIKMALIFSPGQTIGHIKYHKQNNFYSMSRSELQITVSHQLSAAILLLFISTATRFFLKEATWNGGNNFLKIEKHIQISNLRRICQGMVFRLSNF